MALSTDASTNDYWAELKKSVAVYLNETVAVLTTLSDQDHPHQGHDDKIGQSKTNWDPPA